MAHDFAPSVQSSQRKKSSDGQRNGFLYDRRSFSHVARHAPAKAADNFLQAFEKPTQIYRYMTTQAPCKAPFLLHRTLSYMKQRMSRTHHRRAGFKVDDMLDRFLCEIEAQAMRHRRDLTLAFKSFEDPHFISGGEPAHAVISASIVSVHHQPSSSRQLFCVRREEQEREIRRVLTSMERDVPVTSSGAASGTSVRVTISKDIFPKMSKCFIKCLLVITVKPKYSSPGHSRGQGSFVPFSPDTKRKKKAEAAAQCSPGPVFKSEIVIFNSRMECQLVSGKYQVASNLDPQSSRYSSTLWIGTDPAADMSLSQMNSQAKVYLEVCWNEPAKPPVRTTNGFLHSALPDRSCSVTPAKEEEINILFQFLSQNEYQETEAKLHDYQCPWCNLNCLVLKSFACHLKNMHPRFNFRVRYETRGLRTDVQVEVSPNHAYDGSYSGNPQDLFSISGVSYNGPMRRTPCTYVFVNRKCEFHDASDDVDEEEIEPMRPTIHGHDRLYYHTNTCIPIRPQDMDIDSEDENDPQWMRYKTQQMIDEFTDVNDGEKEVMKLWNLHIMKYGFTGDCQIPEACRIFLEDRGEILREKNLRFNFILHLISLYDYGLIDAVQKAALIRKLNAIFSRSYSVVSNGHSVLTQNNVPNDTGCQVA